jgi:hypothetical protein
MCILALVVPQPGGVLQVAANRDEFLKRPAAPPSIWEEGWLAPRDLEAGGTWLGLNPRGLFVGVTNRAGVHRVADRRSRGLLVTDALRAADVPSLHQELAALPADRYNAFHLAYADGTSAGLTWSDGERLHQEWLGPGLHLVTERSLGAGDDRERVGQLREVIAGQALVDLEGWLGGLSRHAATPLASTCVHADPIGYGTRSAFVLHRAPTAAASRCAWTEARPCISPAHDGTAVLRSMGRW